MAEFTLQQHIPHIWTFQNFNHTWLYIFKSLFCSQYSSAWRRLKTNISHSYTGGKKKKKTTQKPPRLYDKRHLPSFMAKCSISNWEQGLWNQESCLKHSSSSKYCNCTNQLCLKQIEMLHWLRFTIYRYVTFGGFQSSENNEKATRDFVISYLPQLGPC